MVFYCYNYGHYIPYRRKFAIFHRLKILITQLTVIDEKYFMHSIGQKYKTVKA